MEVKLRKTLVIFVLCCAISLNAQAPSLAVYPDVTTSQTNASIALLSYKSTIENNIATVFQLQQNDAGAIAALKTQLASDEATISTLQSQATGFASQITTMQAQIAALQQGTLPPVAVIVHVEASTAIAAVPAMQTENTTDSGSVLDVGFIQNGQTYDYSVSVPAAGNYALTVRSSSGAHGGTLTIQQGGTMLGVVSIPATGGWQTWQTVAGPILALPAGPVTLHFVCSGTAGYLFNLHWLELTKQ
jgi:hypothetical protein